MDAMPSGTYTVACYLVSISLAMSSLVFQRSTNGSCLPWIPWTAVTNLRYITTGCGAPGLSYDLLSRIVSRTLQKEEALALLISNTLNADSGGRQAKEG